MRTERMFYALFQLRTGRIELNQASRLTVDDLLAKPMFDKDADGQVVAEEAEAGIASPPNVCRRSFLISGL